MTAADAAATPQGNSLALDFDLPHPPGKVWRAITDPALVSEWLLPVSALPLERDAAFRFQGPAGPGWDGIVNCRIVAAEPPRTLRYTWQSGAIDTVVTFTLQPTAAGTRLTIEQSGFTADDKREFGGAKYGWTMMAGKLADLLARGA